MTCPCPKHPLGCYGHPNECGCKPSEIERMARDSDAEFARLTGIVFDHVKRIEALEAALRPFAKLAEFISENHRDTRPIIYGLDPVLAGRLTIGDLRRAALALTQGAEHGK